MEGNKDKYAPYKVIMAGHQAVGKSSLIHRITNATFIEDYKTTIGVDFKTFSIDIGSRTAEIQIWDTAGQQKFRGLTNSYYRNCHGCICVYDISQPHTLQYAKGYIDTALEFGIKRDCIFLLANKSDKLESEEQIQESCKEGKDYADKLQISYKVVSAKTGNNVTVFSKDLATILDANYGKLKQKQNPVLTIQDSRDTNGCAC